MKPGLLLNRWAREGELPPSPAPHPQKQNLAVYTKELTHLGGGVCNGNNVPDNTKIWLSDGSGLAVYLGATSGNTVIKSNGTFINLGLTPLASNNEVDTNGNTISISASGLVYTDTLGVAELTSSGKSLNSYPCNTYSYPTSTGTANTTMSCTTYTLKTNFGCSGVPEFSDSVALVTGVTFPDGSTMAFTYESQVSGTVTGRLASVTYPNGEVVAYTYVGANYGTNCSDGSVLGLNLTDNLGTWSFSRSGSATTVVGPSPASNKSVYSFSRQGGAPQGYFLTQQLDYQGASTLLRTTVFCYNGNQTSCAGAAAPSWPMTQKDVYTTLAGKATSSRVSQMFDFYYSNVTLSALYDFGASSPTFKTTPLNYGYSWNGSSCVMQEIYAAVNNTPCQVETFDINGNPIGNIYFTYDSKGNQLSASKWASGTISGGTYLTSSATFAANGAPKTVTDVAGVVSTFTNSGCSGAFPTSISKGSLTSTISWNCNGAVATSVTGFDNSTASVVFADPFWRPTSATDALGNVTNTTYTVLTGSNAGITQVESTLSYNGGNSEYDSFSQTCAISVSFCGSIYAFNQQIEGPGSSNWDTNYSGVIMGSTGITSAKMMPCVTTKGFGAMGGCSTSTEVTTTHDALGRPLVIIDGNGGTTTNTYTGRDVLTVIGPAPAGEVVKQTQTEVDGLGRTLSTCRISSAAGSVSCGQDSGGTGFLTTYTYNNAGFVSSVQKVSTTTQTHSFTYDVAGRKLTVTYPESGTTQAFYDTAPSTPGVACSPATFTGRLVKTYDGNGNTACYAYDSIGRKLGIIYSGPNSDGNNKYFVYDSATVNGVTMTNTTGRLAEARFWGRLPTWSAA
jgi:YD repeat-containing protein